MSLTIRLLNYLSGRRPLTVWSICVSAVLLLGCIDYLTGTVITIAFFYLLPISLASWSLGKRAGQVVALLCALALESSHFLAGAESSPFTAFWNLAVRLAVFLVMANLIAEIRRLLTHQTELSHTDALTGIMNRRAFEESARAELAMMGTQVTCLTFVFLDVDDFKSINDTLGHSVGDEVLLQVAACLRSQLWGSDTLARLGGDEFVMLLPNTDSGAAQKVIPRLRQCLMDSMMQHNWPVTFSMGVVTCTAAPQGLGHLVHLGDQLMYTSKRGGKDHVEYAMFPKMSAPPATLPEGFQAGSISKAR